MAKGPYRDETIFRQDIVDFHNYVDTLINSGFISAFGEKRRQKINLVNGYKIIRVAENARKEELIYVCAEKSGKIKYNDNEARSLAEKYIEHSGGKCEFRPVILMEKKENILKLFLCQ